MWGEIESSHHGILYASLKYTGKRVKPHPLVLALLRDQFTSFMMVIVFINLGSFLVRGEKLIRLHVWYILYYLITVYFYNLLVLICKMSTISFTLLVKFIKGNKNVVIKKNLLYRNILYEKLLKNLWGVLTILSPLHGSKDAMIRGSNIIVVCT